MDDEILSELVLGSARGKRPAKVGYEVIRELGEADLAALLAPPDMGTTAPPLQKIRQAHHSLARLLAEGKQQREVAFITGYAESRISILLADPTFQELVEYYRTQKDEIYLDVHQRLANLGMAAIEEIHERLDEKPESFATKTLLEVAELTLDRSVAPPKGAKAGPVAPSGGAEITIKFIQPTEAQPMLEIGGAGGKLIDLEPAK